MTEALPISTRMYERIKADRLWRDPTARAWFEGISGLPPLAEDAAGKERDAQTGLAREYRERFNEWARTQ
jgi:hypothetical protein